MTAVNSRTVLNASRVRSNCGYRWRPAYSNPPPSAIAIIPKMINSVLTTSRYEGRPKKRARQPWERSLVSANLGNRMGKRSDELTKSGDRSPQSTDELLGETEQLLSGTDADAGDSSARPAADRESDPAAPESRSSSSSRRLSLSSALSLPSVPSPDGYFSPKAFLALALLIGTGLLVGGMTIPIAGRIVGMFAVAFAVGLLTSQRRYLEMTAAGVSVGGIAALANHTILAVAGSWQAVTAVGVSAGLAACVGGYYFGRDLRDGLFRDVE